VAAIAVLIGYGVADLAGKVAQVLLVLGVTFGIGPDVLVAVLALDYVRVLIPGVYGLSRAVELLAVAFGTGQAGLSPVDISRNSLIFPKVFSADAGTMTSNAVVLRRGSLAELVPGDKPPTQLIRSADVTLTTGGVALLAVIFKSRGKWRAIFQIPSPGFKSGFHAAYCRMQAHLVHAGNIFVAGITSNLRRVGYQTLMGD